MKHTAMYMTVKRAVEWIEQERGYRTSIPTVYRWILKGVRGHRLSSTFMGGVRLIAAADLQAFLDACNEQNATATTSPIVRVSTTRDTQRRSADRERQINANNEFLRATLGGIRARPSTRLAGHHDSTAKPCGNLATPVNQEEGRPARRTRN